VEELLWRAHTMGNEWAESPELAGSWGLDEDFKDDFDRGFHVSEPASGRN
jgi:hypothetical protein